ncbi:hypothetical protein E2C01_059529 [Portunus trituberculatus]|uniref:Uncharacterized protein n=1 Tax=Portunus trituberculatus TaxID=210409 RepID=A0A5B7H6Y8_PORTR|nr:hypothetical protein [Portunus trituberculatus]
MQCCDKGFTSQRFLA